MAGCGPAKSPRGVTDRFRHVTETKAGSFCNSFALFDRTEVPLRDRCAVVEFVRHGY